MTRSPSQMRSARFNRKSHPAVIWAAVGVYPPRRLVRRHSLELKRIKEQGYFTDLFTQQFRIDQEKFTIAILNANDGTDYDLVRGLQKDVIFAGLLNDDINGVQDKLLEAVYIPSGWRLARYQRSGRSWII